MTALTDPAAAAVRARLQPLRWMAVYALLGFAGLQLLFGLASWLVPAGPGATLVTRANYHLFVNEWTILAPVAAVLLATAVPPALRSARLVTLAALGEYVVVLLLGALTFLFGLSGHFDAVDDAGLAYAFGRLLGALGYLTVGLASLGLAALAGLAALRALRP
jgi:hypothetical protein